MQRGYSLDLLDEEDDEDRAGCSAGDDGCTKRGAVNGGGGRLASYGPRC
jgi:hypothetical protein